MKKHRLIVLIIVLIINTLSCTNSKEKRYILPENATELLATTSGKTWKLAWRYNDGTRMNMAGCFLSYKITYKSNLTFKDNNGEQENCGDSLIGNWEMVTYDNGKSYLKWTSNQLPEVMNIKNHYKYFKILKLDKDTLKLQYRHKQFSSESTFVDTFVTDDILVKDRDFHR
ncbi:hypothetical protein [Aquimarina celericrescens]|uniref:Lipocalin-like domain-containing protein n=1 Tax=Aquimarina celericrescens TaxID=1964542 RepID=A0ABW5AZZ3_9FLAO